MNKLIFNNILYDFLIFFLIAISASSIIIWVFQAVNFLDIMIEDGRGYLTYLNYSLLNLPKIISRLLPFVLFFSFFYILNANEAKNELLIFWNFGINKIQVVYLFFYFSIVIMIFQILLTAYVVPNTLQLSRSLIARSDVNLFEGFIQPKKFNDTVKGLTIYADDYNDNGELSNIYIKKDNKNNSYQITYANTGRLIIGNNNVLELYNGETINGINGKISSFIFEKSDFSLNNLKTNIIETNKIQETTTLQIFSCLNNIYNWDIIFLNNVKLTSSIHNCENLEIIYKELYKRFIIPFYIPVLFLTTLILLFVPKENKNFINLKIFIFLTNFFLIVISESSIKFINTSLKYNLIIISIPFLIITFLIINFIYQFKLKFKNIL
jgi:lipopolysaccharide export system permease protein